MINAELQSMSDDKVRNAKVMKISIDENGNNIGEYDDNIILHTMLQWGLLIGQAGILNRPYQGRWCQTIGWAMLVCFTDQSTQ